MVSLELKVAPRKRVQRGIEAYSSSTGWCWHGEMDNRDLGNSFPLSILFLLQKRNKPAHKTWRSQGPPSCRFQPFASIKYYFTFGEMHINIFIFDTFFLAEGCGPSFPMT